VAEGAWSDDENDLIVGDYFAMLRSELEHRLYNKADHNRRLQSEIGRSRTAIEYKHRNISAVLRALGETWIEGYAPAINFQATLIDAVLRWLGANPAWSIRPPSPAANLLAENPQQLWLGPPPTLRNEPPPEDLQLVLNVAHKFDVAGRDERNRSLGKAGELLVLNYERSTLAASGREDLARRVKWTSDEEGDGAGFDIASFLPNGRERLVEVKTTNGWERTPFLITRNELKVADERREDWYLVRLWNFGREPKGFELRPPLDAHVSLTASTFQASFN
jgi:hypothetical protein